MTAATIWWLVASIIMFVAADDAFRRLRGPDQYADFVTLLYCIFFAAAATIAFLLALLT